MSEETNTYGVLLYTVKCDDYLLTRASVVTVTAAPGRRFRNIVDPGVYADLLATGISCVSQNVADQRMSYVYGMEIEYRDVFSASVRDLERMLKAIKGVHRKMERMQEREGRPLTFGQFCNQFARSVGAVFMISERRKPNGGGYDDPEAYLWSDLFSGAEQFNSAIEKAVRVQAGLEKTNGAD